MRDLMKKYGNYEFNKGNLYIEITDDEIVRPNLTNVLISFCGSVIILTATEHFYDYFSSIFTYDWNEKYIERYDLAGKNISDFTRKTLIFRKIVVKDNIWLKFKKTEELHLESTNWTLKILDFENGKLLKKDFDV